MKNTVLHDNFQPHPVNCAACGDSPARYWLSARAFLCSDCFGHADVLATAKAELRAEEPEIQAWARNEIENREVTE